jgi:hypothetical protein
MTLRASAFACSAVLLAAPAAVAAPAKDTYSLHVTKGSGAYAGASGQAVVVLHPRGAGKRRKLKLVFRPVSCTSSGACLQLGGTLRGTISLKPGPRIPDTGATHNLRASGRLAPLGQVTLKGTTEGTGFIQRGRIRMRLELTSSHGTLKLAGKSGEVAGFTSP